ncbi:MAG: hypothetical protein KAI66_15470 [Lentisphaeria bacterium]|nr:hypothetical protein [Lentisphaeria bacterium]
MARGESNREGRWGQWERRGLVCGGGAEYLRQRLLLPEHGVKPYVRWVRCFLDFARPIRELGFEPCLDRFLAELARTPSRPSWHAGQAKDAVQVYYYQYRRGGSDAPPPGNDGVPDIPELLSELNFSGQCITLRRGKGDKDRYTLRHGFATALLLNGRLPRTGASSRCLH